MEIKLFNKWETNHITIQDQGLVNYINLEPIIVPKTGGRNVKIRFHKNKYHIVERLINKLMVPGHRGKKHRLTSGHNTGKGQLAYRIVEKTFEIIEKRLKQNPVEVFVRALENAAPRDEITTIEYGGAKYPQAVDCGSQRRVDLAMRLMIQGSYGKSFNSKKRIQECLADEIIAAYNLDSKSTAIAKKLELERQADSSR
ncbi:MAG: 30S ribosomal protein S7 [Nanoarchaeota archaeon]